MTRAQVALLRRLRKESGERVADRVELIGAARGTRVESQLALDWADRAALAELFRRGEIWRLERVDFFN